MSEKKIVGRPKKEKEKSRGRHGRAKSPDTLAARLAEHGKRERLLMLERFEKYKKEMERNAEKRTARVRGSSRTAPRP
jgi:hypothetical protein